jgi:CBS domain-containing protein
MADARPPDPKLVRDLMSVGVETCSPDATVVDLAQLMLNKNKEGVVVLDNQGHAVGAVTWDCLVNAYATGDYAGLCAADIMLDDVPQIPPDIPLTAAAQIMLDRGVRVAFMTHHAGGVVYPAAVLTFHHLLRHMAVSDPGELRDLGIQADREPPLATFRRRRDEARLKTRRDAA